jgi:carbon starvation protein
MIGRAGGAPTFALGMAQILAGVLRSRAALAVWYHFAIMFEALFILTTIDAGTRVGRFLVQDLLGLVWRPLGDTRSLAGNLGATTLFVSAWGWFLYQGVVDPLGGINSLWPIFGVANQLLAVIALALGTTVLIKMGRVRYLWVTLLPLAWLLAVTMTAGWMKIFAADPRLGFLSQAAGQSQQLVLATGAAAEALRRQIFNAEVNVAVTAVFMILVATVVLTNVRAWWLLLNGRRAPLLREEPFVAASGLRP